jgi:hypothetical protein
MRKLLLAAAVLLASLSFTGCMLLDQYEMADGAAPGARAGEESATKTQDPTDVRADRMLIWTASLDVEVWNVPKAVANATAMAERHGGYVERKSDSGEESASLTLRIPLKAFKDSMAGFEALGTVTHRSVQAEDVTEQYVDVEARVRNKVALRDRLKQLLDKATTVKDILAIETELNRVQADLDSMEARIKALKGRVDYATVRLSLRRRPILGPLGYLFRGLWWGVEKLFVLRP